MSDPNQPVIIIRKKKGGHAGHHGGAWKVAYADFMTAMMAFFLLMWLLNTATPAQRKAIADYFAPMGIALSEGGSGGAMGGASITASQGSGVGEDSAVNLPETMTTTAGKGQEGDEDVAGKSEKSADGTGNGKNEVLTPQQMATKDAAALAVAMKSEEEKFKSAETQILQAITQTPGLEGLSQHLVIDRTAEGLRIQIIDRDGFSLFPSGVSTPYEKGRDLLRLVGRVISRLPNKISITGHTDASPFSRNARRDNWDLSSDRANVSRAELEAGGVAEGRIARVVGLSDRDPYIPDNPQDPRNRRISIVLLRHGLNTSEPKPEAEPAPETIKTKVKGTP